MSDYVNPEHGTDLNTHKNKRVKQRLSGKEGFCLFLLGVLDIDIYNFYNVGRSKKSYTNSITFLISLVNMHLSILRTVDISICSLEMELSQVVKLSTVARKRTQVNFKILNILLMILSRRKEKKQDFKRTICHQPFCCVCHGGVLSQVDLGLATHS